MQFLEFIFLLAKKYKMLDDYHELNENVLYLLETLKYCEQAFRIKLAELNRDNTVIFNKVKMKIDLVIKICLKSQPSDPDYTKFEIFSHLISRYFENKSVVPSPRISFDLLIDLIIENKFKDLFLVLKIDFIVINS
jgi:hypothetical protein